MAADPDENAWIFDSLINFLQGPIWKVPILAFIEEKSVVFDPESYHNLTEDRESEYRKIFEEYKALVDYMLTNFMEDIQVTPSQVEAACKAREEMSNLQPESRITKDALEELWAAEDFQTFRRLMTRKNVELQLQSLELLVAKYGVISPSLCAGDVDHSNSGEDEFLQVVMSQMLEQEKDAARKLSKNKDESDDELSLTGVEIMSVAPQQHRMLSSVRRKLEMPDRSVSTSQDSDTNIKFDMSMGTEQQLTKGDKLDGGHKAGASSEAMASKQEWTEEELEKRKAYLRAQRDKLVELKKKEREKQLVQDDESPAASQTKNIEGDIRKRPKSARAAKLALSQPSVASESSKSKTESGNNQSLNARRALANILKQELLQNDEEN